MGKRLSLPLPSSGSLGGTVWHYGPVHLGQWPVLAWMLVKRTAATSMLVQIRRPEYECRRA